MTGLSFAILSYKEWVALHPEAGAECPECDGAGVVECPCCGHEATCERCDGTGWIEDPWLAYKEQRKRDLIALERWLGGEPVIEDGVVVVKSARSVSGGDTPRADPATPRGVGVTTRRGDTGGHLASSARHHGGVATSETSPLAPPVTTARWRHRSGLEVPEASPRR